MVAVLGGGVQLVLLGRQGGAAAVQLLALALEFHAGTSAAQGPMSPEQLCGHHYRVSQTELRAAGAVVYDEAGVPITAGISDYQHSRHQPAAASPRP